ncbi:MAG: tetratricopeptide repeat protein, partial [Roseimicrobium sp.]
MPPMKMLPRPGLWIGTGLSLTLGFSLLGGTASLQGAPTRADVQSSEAVSTDLSLQPEREKLAQAHAHYVSARMLEDEGRMREALGHYLAFLEKGGAEPDLVAHIAEMALSYQGMDAAVKLLEDAMKASPASAQPYVNFTNFALTHANPENGLQARAATAAAEAVTRFPQNAEAYENAVRLHLSQKERAKAAEVLEHGAKQPVTDAEYWLRLGRAAQEVWPLADGEQRAEHLARVNVFFDKAMLRAREAKDEAAEMWIADYYLFSNQLDRATVICEWVIQRNGSLDARKRLVRLYEAMERPDDSLKALEELVNAFPQDVEHQRLLAGKFDQRRRTAFGEERIELARKAAEHFEAALQAGGGEVEDYIMAASLIESTGDGERFERFTARAQQLYPGEPRMGYLRAVALNSVKKHAEAAKMFEETAKLAETRSP